MRKCVCAVAALLAFAFVDPAWSITQGTTSTVTKPPDIDKATIIIEQPGRPAQPIEVSKDKPRATQRVTVDTEKPVVVRVEIPGQTPKEPIRFTDGATFSRFRGDLGIPGLTFVNTPPSTARQPRTPTGGPRTPAVSEVVRPMDPWSGNYISGYLIVNRAKFGILETDATSGHPTNSFRESDTGVSGGFSMGSNMPSGNGPLFTPFVAFDFPWQDVAHEFTGGTSISEKVKFIATLGLALGYPVTAELLFYGLGGVALVDKKFTIDFGAPFVTSEVKWLWGGTLGVGVAYQIPGWRGWSAFAQYQHIWVQDAHLDRPAASPGFNYTFDNDIDMFKFGLIMQLGADGWPMRAMASDSRLKRDIERVAQLDSGLGLYRYRYLWSDTEYVGVMAQEVAEIRPEAVHRGADGFLRVDYAKLGTRLMTWPEWSLQKSLASNFVAE